MNHESWPGSDGGPVTEPDLHAYVDGRLPAARRVQVEAFLAARPDERERVEAWRQQNRLLRGMLDPVLHDPLPERLPRRQGVRLDWRLLAAGVAIAVVSAAGAWVLRGALMAPQVLAATRPAPGAELPPFARRAAVAHLVYSPDARRPVEVDAAQEAQLVTWLSKRLGTPIHPPALSGIGYALMGGRLLPGESGPVAQFMYHDEAGHRLTLYVTREAPAARDGASTAFQFGQDGRIDVFYWIDKHFGYAISGDAGRQELLRVSQEVYRQMTPS